MTPTDHQLSRQQRLSEYLESFRKEATRVNENSQIISLAYKCFNALYSSLSPQVLEVPDCCPSSGNEGDFHITFTWNKDNHYLECEVMANGTLEFFYRNHLTKEVWGKDYHITDEHFPDSVYDEVLLDKLSYFVE